MSWELEFKKQWENFCKLVKSGFKQKYHQERGWLKSKIPLNIIINNVVENEVKSWENTNHYHGAWLRKLNREHPNLGKEFETRINNIKVAKPLKEGKPFSKLEIAVGLLTIIGSLTMFFWGQNLRNFDFANVNFKQGAAAIGIIMGGIYTLKTAKEKREDEQEERIIQEIMNELKIYQNQLIEIVVKADKIKS